MYRTTRSPMMQPLVNSGMGMAPFFKVNAHTIIYMIQWIYTICASLLEAKTEYAMLMVIELISVTIGDCVRAGAFPGQVLGVHLRVLQHSGLRTGQHPLHQGGERSVSLKLFPWNKRGKNEAHCAESTVRILSNIFRWTYS